MLKRMLRYLLLLLLLAMPWRGGWAQSPPETFAPGPDIILGNLSSLIQAGSDGTQVGLAIGTDICNNGNVQANWFRLPETDHPVIPQNLYRLSGGATNDERFEQIGQSWVMHQYFPLQQNACGFGCTPSPDFAHLGVGCSTADSASINGSQVDLGSRAWVHPFTGAFLSTSNSHTGHTHDGTTHRILVEANDLNTTMNQGATYYAEAQLITPQEYAWCQAHPGECNMFNNVSYRQFTVVGTTSFNFSGVGDTERMTPAINAWPGATIQTIEPEPGVDGRAFIAYKVTQTGPFEWHYEYAIYNQNLDRGIQSFSVPAGCGIGMAGNLGFHAPLNHPGIANDGTAGDAGYSNVPWSMSAGPTASWSTETFAQNPNANALRWGTLYNFRFDGGPPILVNATIGFFKTGAPMTVSVPGPVPECAPSPTPPPPPTPTPTPFFFADLAVTKTDSADPVQVGSNLTYTITVSRLDPGTAMAATMTDILPAGVDFVSVTPSQGSCTGTSTIVCELGNIAELAPATVSVVVTPTAAGTLTNTASVPDFEDPNPGNNSDTEVTTVIPQATPTPPPCDKFPGENFDSVTAPALPPGWSSTFWVTSTVTPDTAPNSAFVEDPPFVSDRELISPQFAINSASAQVVFRNNYNLESSETEFFDGGVLEISVNGGPFVDVTHPSVGSFASGGYNAIISDNSGSPIAGREAWSGNSGGYISTVLNLGPNLNGQTIQLKFRMASDTKGAGVGWRIDTISFIGVCGEVTPTPTPTPTPNPTPTPTATSTPTPAPSPTPAAQTVNLSTRMFVQTGDAVGIGGFIITGTGPKHVLLRAIGPSLSGSIQDPLADPVLELHGPGGFVTIINNNWRDTQEQEIIATGIPPTDNLESAIVATLDPGPHTAIVSGSGNTSGVALIELYDLDLAAGSKLANISTRAFVQTGPEIVIAGFILGNGAGVDNVVVRALGPSLSVAGVKNVLADPTLELRNSNGTLLISNDNWQDDPVQAAIISAAGLAPSDEFESAIAASLPPGSYTALLAGALLGFGNGLVEVYDLGTP